MLLRAHRTWDHTKPETLFHLVYSAKYTAETGHFRDRLLRRMALQVMLLGLRVLPVRRRVCPQGGLSLHETRVYNALG